MMKVLQVIRPASGGMKKHVFSLMSGLRENGIDVMLAAPPEVAQEAVRMGFPAVTLPLRGEISPWADSRCLAMLRNVVKKEKISLVHLHGAKAGLIGRVALLGMEIPVVYTAHNDIIAGNQKSVKEKTLARLETILSYRTARIITVSRAVAIGFLGRGIPPEKISVVYNGLDFSPFRHSENAGPKGPTGSLEKIVGTVCRLIPQKGLDDLLTAAPPILKDHPEVRFWVIGDGPYRTALEQKAADLNIGDKIIFWGEREDIPRLLGRFSLFVLPSWSEGFSIALLEAQAAGLPVIATQVGGTAEAVVDGSILVPPHNPAALAQAVQILLDSPERRLDLGRRGQKWVAENFLVNKMVSETLAIYQQVH